MTRNLSYLVGIILTIVIGTFFYFTCCSDCRLAVADQKETKEEMVPAPEPEATAFPFSFTSGDYAYNVNDNFNFELSSTEILSPLSGTVTQGVASLKTFLEQNSDKVINITGLYLDNETNNTAFPNLGLARANTVKNYFADNGILSSQTNTFGKLMSDLVPQENTLLGPVTFAIVQGATDAEEELKALHDAIKADPLVLYFNTGKAAINLTAAQRQKVANISRYLDKVDGATCKVVGHTDNTGDRITNIVLGQERADFAMSYLTRNGISAKKITATSQGPDAPIASNETEEGKSKNRRTGVTLN